MWKTRIPYRLIDFSSRIHPSDNFVIGIKKISDTGGSGTWALIDENDNIVDVEDGYFEHHPCYQFEEVSLAGNDMVAIPKFYVKSDTSGRFWISPTPKDGFHVHPAFMSKGKEISETVTNTDGTVTDITRIMIGKWQSWIDYYHILSNKKKMWSMPSWDGRRGDGWDESKINELEAARRAKWIEDNRAAWTRDHETMSDSELEVSLIAAAEEAVSVSEAERLALRTIYPSTNSSYWENWHAADAWNDHDEDGNILVNGFHMMTIWEWSALQLLALIEGRTTDVQTRYGRGWTMGDRVDSVSGQQNMTSNFHGIIGLWGNVWQWIQGIQTYYNGHIFIWDNLGNEIWKDTGKMVPMRGSDLEVWSPGETCGYWRDRIYASGYNYDTSDMFIPDKDALVSDYFRGAYSDGIWGRTKSAAKDLYACAVGGSYDSGDWGGMFGWNFNVRLGNEVYKNGMLQEEIVWSYGDVASRLCFAPVNLAPQPEDEEETEG